MQPEEREILDRVLRLSEENNKMLISLHRSVVFNRILKIVYVVLIIAGSIASYYFLQSFLGGSGAQSVDTFKQLQQLYTTGDVGQ